MRLGLSASYQRSAGEEQKAYFSYSSRLAVSAGCVLYERGEAHVTDADDCGPPGGAKMVRQA